jgi:uncharacterized RDD family membrane protein YckC
METIKLASDQQRISNLVIDTAIIYFTYLAIASIFLLKGWVIYSILFFAYYLAFESSTKRTIGKFITKTRVVNTDGSIPKFATIFLRTLFRYIPFELFSFLGSKNPIGWHDDLSKTRVEKVTS